MDSLPGPLFLAIAGIAAVAVLLGVASCGEARADVRFWLTLALVATVLFVATQASAGDAVTPALRMATSLGAESNSR